MLSIRLLRHKQAATAEEGERFLDLVQKAFYGHAGRPGQRGGSMPRGASRPAEAYAQAAQGPVPPESVLLSAVLTPKQRAVYEEHVNEIQQDIRSGLESYKVHSVNGDGTGGYTKTRLAQQRNIMRDLINQTAARAKPGPGETPKFIVVGGRGGSGKSSFKEGTGPDAATVYNEEHVITVDADKIKGALAALDGRQNEGHLAPIYHEESGHMANRMLAMARARGLNTVYDATLKTDKPYITENFKRAGYQIEAHYMHLPREQAARRALKRYVSGTQDGRTGRLVPPSVIYKNTDNERNFDKMVARGVSKWSVWDNNVPEGSAPKLVAKS